MLIFIILALPSCDNSTPKQQDGGSPEITDYERAKALEAEANATLQGANTKIKLVYSDGYTHESSTLVLDNGKISLEKTVDVSQLSMAFICGTAYVKTSVAGYETKRCMSVNESEALLLISELCCRSIKLTTADFISAVYLSTDGKERVSCMIAADGLEDEISRMLNLHPGAISLDLCEYSFAVSCGKYEEISYLLRFSLAQSDKPMTVSVRASFDYSERYTVELPEDFDEYENID